jgi:hypothetical protein
MPIGGRSSGTSSHSIDMNIILLSYWGSNATPFKSVSVSLYFIAYCCKLICVFVCHLLFYPELFAPNVRELH